MYPGEIDVTKQTIRLRMKFYILMRIFRAINDRELYSISICLEIVEFCAEGGRGAGRLIQRKSGLNTRETVTIFFLLSVSLFQSYRQDSIRSQARPVVFTSRS